jgi:hypothetical protein
MVLRRKGPPPYVFSEMDRSAIARFLKECTVGEVLADDYPLI